MKTWNKEYIARTTVMKMKRKILGQNIYDSALKIEFLINEMREKPMADHSTRINEIEDACVSMRIHLEELP